jgi:psp operon transcriptional activator
MAIITRNRNLHPFEALGQSDSFLEFQERLSRVAPVMRPVLLLGERGTGKELAAARIHYLSGRWAKPFVTLNCAALSPALIESELFGYERGAFTGAVQRRLGRFEAADGGTIFLDEIGNVPLEAQEEILRVVEYHTFERVGSVEGVAVDVRIVAATHADLPGLAADGRFRPDLLDRLSFEVLRLPPLRERGGDVLLLARHFATEMAREIGRSDIPEFNPGAVAALNGYAWPGNVRELKNVVERAVCRAEGAEIGDVVFNPFPARPDEGPGLSRPHVPVGPPRDAPDTLSLPMKEAVRELKDRMLQAALNRARHNQRKAAALLGLSYDQFRGFYRSFRKRHPDAV